MKQLDNHITIEGLFSMVLFTEVVKTGNKLEHVFVTNNEGESTAKSPMGMFTERFIPNDLQAVLDRFRQFHNI